MAKRSFIRVRPFCRLLLLGFFVLPVLGCSGGPDLGPTGTVSGKLSYKGQPVAAGTAVVLMNMTAGYTCMGETDAQGNYTLDSWNNGDLPVGKYDVMISPPGPDMDAGGGESDVDNPEAASEEEIVYDFPKKYSQLATSGLSFEVKEGPNQYDIDLVD